MKTFNNLVEQYMPLNEGLIVSFDVEKLKSKLYSVFGKLIEYVELDFSHKKFEKEESKYGTALTLNVLFKIPMLGTERKVLEEILNVFGYYISIEKENSKYFQIEPKYSIKFDPKEWNISQLYHTTLKKNIPKIMKFGLIPKETQTHFDHPPDRIYFFHTRSSKILESWMRVIAKSKNHDINDMALLSVNVKPYQKYYLDDTSTIENEIISVYTTNAIPYTEIKIIQNGTN